MTHVEVSSYNWDDGLGLMWPVVNDPTTDHGTALLIYWRIEGPWLTEELTAHNPELERMKKILETRLLEGFYKNRTIRYDPISDNHLSRVQVFKLLKVGVPVEFIEPKY